MATILRQLAPAIALFVSVGLILVQSPALPNVECYPLTDSSVFQLVATLFLNGEMPYVDIFDHKGPLIYLIDAVALSINREWGVWLVEYAFLYVTALLWYVSARKLDASRSGAVALCIVCVLAVGESLEGGNLIEEYSLLFISYPLYLCVRASCGEPLNPGHLLLAGLSLTAILMLKFPAALFQLPFLVGIALVAFRCGRLLRDCLWFFVGFLGSLGGFLIWLFANHALSAFANDYLLYNSLYAGHALFAERLASLAQFASSFLLLGAFVLTIALLKEHDSQKQLLAINIIALSCGFAVTTTTGYAFAHYAMFFVPCFVAPFARGLALLGTLTPSPKLVASSLVSFFLLFNVAVPCMQTVADQTVYNLETTEKNKAVIELLREFGIKPGSRIAVMGNACWIYLETDTRPVSTYAYLPAHLDNSIEWMSRILDTATDNDAPLVVQNATLAHLTEEEEATAALEESFTYLDGTEGFSLYISNA